MSGMSGEGTTARGASASSTGESSRPVASLAAVAFVAALAVLAAPQRAVAADASQAPPAAAADARCEVPDDLVVRARLPGFARALASRTEPPTIVVLQPDATSVRQPDSVRWPARLQSALAARLRRPDLRVDTVPRPQSDATRLAALLKDSVIAKKPALVLWPVGRADLRQGLPPRRFGDRLRGGLEQLRREGIDVVVLDVVYHPQSEALLRSDDYRQYLRWITDDVDVPRMRRFEMIEHWAQQGRIDFDSVDPAAQATAVDVVQQCIAVQLAAMIAAGAGGAAR